MSLPIAITDLLHGASVEWERLEFKRRWNPEAALHTVCAFANDFHNLGGGYIVIGVAEEDGRPVLPPAGMTPQEADSIQKELLNLGNSAIRPAYHPLVAPYEVDGKLILVLWAPGGRTRPYRARSSLSKDKDDYTWFIRKNSSTVKARGADETELMGLAATVPLDDRENIFASVDDLSRDLMVAYLREVGSDLAGEAANLSLVDLGRRMGVVGGTREAPYPINVGLLFFHPEPWRFFPATQIDVVWFPDGRGGDRFTEKEFRGPLHQIIRDALIYIQRTFLSTTVIKHADRAEADRVANYPFEAIEEALVNAVYHRGYDLREPIEVRITREELAVVSYPGPDRSVKPQELASGRAMSRRYRNRRIGELLKELELTEGRGTGVPKIQRAMQANGSPPPVFQFDEDHSYFATILPAHPAAKDNLGGDLHGDLGGEEDLRGADTAQVNITLKGGDRQDGGDLRGTPTAQVTAQVMSLLENLDADLTRSELQAALGLTHREHFRKSYLVPALEMGLIEMTEPDKPNSRSQRYRLTAAGQEMRRR